MLQTTGDAAKLQVGNRSSAWIMVVACAALANPAGVLGTITPTIINSYIARETLSLQAASLLESVELYGMTLALLCGPLFINRYDRRLTAYMAIVVLVLGQLLSFSTDQPWLLGGLRGFAGLGEGVLYAIAVASLSATAYPDRAFGVVGISNQIAITVLLTIIARLSLAYPVHAAISVYSTLIILTFFVIPKIPRAFAPTAALKQAVDGRPFSYGPAIGGLGGALLLNAAFGAVWPLIGQIAVTRGVHPETIGEAFSLVGLGGIAAGAIVATLGVKFGRLLPTCIASIGFAACLALPTYSVSFVPLTVLLLFFWALSIPYYLGLLAKADVTGRMAVMTSAMIPFGIAVGQMIAGPMAKTYGFRAVTTMGSIFALLALMLMLATMFMVMNRDVIGRGVLSDGPA